MTWQAPLDSSLTSILVSCKDRFMDTSLTFRQVFVPWKVTEQMFGKNLSSIADAKHWVEGTSTDYFGKGRQVETLNYWVVSFSCTSPAFQRREKQCMSLAMSKSSALRNTSQPAVTALLAPHRPALNKTRDTLNWNDWGWRREWVHCESYGYIKGMTCIAFCTAQGREDRYLMNYE